MTRFLPGIRRQVAAWFRRSHIAFALSLTMVFLCWPLHNHVQAAAGDLDPTFGAGGLVVTEFFGGSDEARALLVQPDGRIIAVGTASEGSPNSDFALARYNPDGSLDPSWGNGGKVTTDLFGNTDFAFDAVLQPDGKVVAVGETFDPTTGLDFALARYNRDGSLDASFGAGGKVRTDFFGNFDQAFAAALQPDGKIIAAGFIANPDAGHTDFALARYNRDGSLDTSFGSGGKVTTDFLNSADEAFAVAIQADGKIVLAGEATSDPRFLTMFALARYNRDGSLDTSFGSGGKVTTGVGLLSRAFDVVIQPDGKIVAAGDGVGGDGHLGADIALVRYNPNGSLDAGFGSGGVVTRDVFGRFDGARAVALQRDGKIVVAGETDRGREDFDVVVARFTTSGSLDPTFGSGGIVTTDYAGANTDEDLDVAEAVAIQADGKIVVAGITLASDGNWDFLLARYLGDESSRFDLCLQDESNGGLLQINTMTGEYQFTNCAGLTVGGTGTITRRGAVVNLQHNAADRRVRANINTAASKATATVQLIPQRRTFVITDRDITNNPCACQ
jgi:uncharacterized delta-60 repeat protein